jgi:ankyrin repeat protein
VKLLCQNNAEVNLQDNNVKTALHFGILYFQFIFEFKLLILYIYCLASQNGHLEVVQFLIQNRADINLQDNEGRTALILGILLFN